MIWHDDGKGVPARSLAHFRQYKDCIGKVTGAEMLDALHDDGHFVKYPLRIRGTGGEIWLSGCRSRFAGPESAAAYLALFESGYQHEFARLPLKENAFLLGPPENPELVEEQLAPQDWPLSLDALKVLEIIQELYEEEGKIPTLRAISAKAGYGSPSGADWRIGELVKAGKARKGKKRGVGLIWFEGKEAIDEQRGP